MDLHFYNASRMKMNRDEEIMYITMGDTQNLRF